MLSSSSSTSNFSLVPTDRPTWHYQEALWLRWSRKACTIPPWPAGPADAAKARTAHMSATPNLYPPSLTCIACLNAFITVRSISPASKLVSPTSLFPILSNCGKVIATILSKSPLLSPDLNLYTRQIARRQCVAAETDVASWALRSWTVMSKKPGQFSGKSV